jgi:hypothetical protein
MRVGGKRADWIDRTNGTNGKNPEARLGYRRPWGLEADRDAGR